jgi:hypothetical protein
MVDASRLVGLSAVLAVGLGLLWLGVWLLDIVLGPFTPILAAVVLAVTILVLFGVRD